MPNSTRGYAQLLCRAERDTPCTSKIIESLQKLLIDEIDTRIGAKVKVSQIGLGHCALFDKQGSVRYLGCKVLPYD